MKKKPPTAPQAAIGAVVMDKNRILLVKRKYAPNRGKWSIPGGSIELGETLREAAEREILEETGLTVRAREPIYCFDYIERERNGRVRFHYVIVDLAADLVGGELKPSDDAADAGWFAPGEIQKLNMTKSTRTFLAKIGWIE
jgi:ADP-ribose pyrophosphatase